RTCDPIKAMSALPPRADIGGACRDVRYVPKADIAPHRAAAPQCASTESGDAFVALNLAAVHQAPCLGIKRVATMQHGEIVPHQEIANLPLVAHDKVRLRRMLPQRVEQRFAFSHAETAHVSVGTATKEKRFATSLRIGANHRMMRPDRLANIGDFLVSLAQHTGTVT